MTDPIPFLDLKAQQRRIEPALRARLDAVLAHCQFVLGPEVRELESRLAAYAGAAHCVTVSSGTDALQIAMMAEGIGRGHAVFLPAFTYTATAEVPLVLGATPVFVDIDPATFQIDPDDLQRRIASVKAEAVLRPRAVVGVDLFGQPALWPALREIAATENLFILDDCAQSFGASLNGRKLGREADATAISFFPSKPLGGYGDGGALLTESAERADLYRSLRTHGEGTTRYEVLRTGMNGRLDTLQAAILLAKLDVFEEELASRAKIAAIYDRALTGRVTPPARVENSESAWAIYAILLENEPARTRLQSALKESGIPTAIYYPRRCTISRPTPATTEATPCRSPKTSPPASSPSPSTPTSPNPRPTASPKPSSAQPDPTAPVGSSTQQWNTGPMPEKSDANSNPHLHNPQTGTSNGVPKGVTHEESTGLPDSGRQATESGPIHQEKAEE